MKKLFAIAMALITIAAIPAVGQTQNNKPVQEIPAPPGATITTEMSITRAQIIDMLPLFISQSCPDVEIDSSKLDEALGTLERVQYSEMKITGKKATADMLALFEKKVNGKRIIYDRSNTCDNGMLLIALPENSGYFSVSIEPERDKNSKIIYIKIKAIKLTGCPDIAKVIELFGPALSQFVSGISTEKSLLPGV